MSKTSASLPSTRPTIRLIFLSAHPTALLFQTTPIFICAAFGINLTDDANAVETIGEVIDTFKETLILLIIIVFISLQSFRATLIPMLEIPVSDDESRSLDDFLDPFNS